MAALLFSTRIQQLVLNEVYEVHIFGVPVETTVTGNADRALGWIEHTIYLHAVHGFGGPGLVWGLEVCPHVDGIHALLLCWANRCLIFQISRSVVTQALGDFFDNRDNMFVGVGVHAKINGLYRRYGIGGHSAYQDLCLAAGVPMDMTLDQLVVHTYGRPVRKPAGSNRWNLQRISRPNIHASCVDVYLSWEMATHVYN